MHQLSLHYTASCELNSAWLAQVLLFIFCLLFWFGCCCHAPFKQPMFHMECYCLAFPPYFSQQSTAVCPRLGLWSKETGSFGCELQFPCGASIKVSKPSSYTELSFLLWWADWEERSSAVPLALFLVVHRYNPLTFSVQHWKYSVFKSWKELTSKSASKSVISSYTPGFCCSCLHLN